MDMLAERAMRPLTEIMATTFPKRLVTLRKQKGLTQQALSDLTGVHLTQIRRYEGGVTLPTFEILRKLAVALSVPADVLLFDDGERGPDDDLRLQFEATSRLSGDEKRMVREFLDAIVLKHEARRWASSA
jgi:transcriptional regulator with XRE-family HTH domain